MVRLPVVGADTNVWGPILNNDLDAIQSTSPFSFKKQLFGTGLDGTPQSIPLAPSYTLAAIAGTLNTVPSLGGSLPELTIGTQLTGLTTDQVVRLTPGIYREAPTISTRITLKGQCDVSFRCSDNWSTGGVPGNVWSAAPAPNATNGIRSSLTVPAMAADSGGAPVLGGTSPSGATYAYLAANREMVWVDGVAYNRVPAGTTLAAGQWMFGNDGSDRRVILYLAGGAGAHLIEVTTRELWLTPNAAGITFDGIDFRHAPSGNSSQWPMNNQNLNSMVWTNCMFGQTHGMAMNLGNGTLLQVLNCVFHNNGSEGGTGTNIPGVFFRGNVLYNNGGTQNTYAGFLDAAGYDPAWSSGGYKFAACDGGVYDGNVAFNNGGSCLWSDVLCRYDVITNNVCWDSRNSPIQYEVSKYGKIAGNVVFQSNNSRFYQGNGLSGTPGIYIATSRGVDLGGDPLSGGLMGNLVMRYPIGIRLGWTHSRIGVAEVQSLGAQATSGTVNFTLSWGGATTGNIAWNATAAVVQAALEGLWTIRQGGVVCTGGPSGTSAITITFGGRLAAGPQALITVGGGTPSPVISRTTAGTGDAPLGGFTDCVSHGNIVIARWSGNGVLTSPDVFVQWADDVSGADIPTVGANRGPYGYGNAYGFEGAKEDNSVFGVVWPLEYLWHSSLITNQDSGNDGLWWTFAEWLASRWENGGPVLGTAHALTGTVAKAGTTTLTGTSTKFLTELGIGSLISVPGVATELRQVAAIASDTSLTVDLAFAQTSSGQTAQRVIATGVYGQSRMLSVPEMALYLGRFGLSLGN